MSPVFNRPVLLDMLTYCRPCGSDTEQVFVEKYIATLPGASRDTYGNWHVVIGDSDVMWSCHTDTVHRHDGRQTVHVGADGIVGLSKRSAKQSACLGADDTAGVFLAWSMVNAGIPGYYIFHYGEEVGGLGSRDLALSLPDDMAHIRFAIALDRGGLADIITHQSGRRTASEAFADSLASHLNSHGLTYAPSSHGTYTDTFEYADIIPECSNLSVGYAGAHSPRECLDLCHVETLLTALCELDQTSLVCARTPEPETRWTALDSTTWSSSSGLYDMLTCEYCKLAFYACESNATMDDTFCCEDCESAYFNESTWRDDTGIYLSREYHDVQLSLLKGIH
jgi:hypothetical protein